MTSNFLSTQLPQDELHYAELSINAATKVTTVSNDLNGTGTLTKKIHQSSSSGSGGGGTLSRKPPTYDYFEEPTIYAQIDPYKTQQTTTTSTTSPYAQCISSPSASQGTPSTVSPGAVAAMYMPQHPGGYHTLPHQQQQHQPLPQQQHYHHQYGTISSSSASHYQQGSGHYHHPGGTIPPPPPPHPSKQIAMVPTTGIVAATTLTSPSSSIPGLGAIGKSYSREIVTVRTPLMYSQQESCV